MVVSLNPTQKAVIQWTPGDDKAEWYEARLRNRDVNPPTYSSVLKVVGLETPALRPRSGHWAYEVRACRVWEGKDQCSEWLKSDEKGEPEPWIIFWKPPPVTGIVIEDEGAN